MGGQRKFRVKVAIFQLLKQPPVLYENMRNWKERNGIFLGFIKAIERWGWCEAGVVQG